MVELFVVDSWNLKVKGGLTKKCNGKRGWKREKKVKEEWAAALKSEQRVGGDRKM